MSERQDRYADLVTIAAAARDTHKRREFIRDFAERRRLLVPVGKRDLVPLTELRNHLAATKPPTNHPLVRC